MICKQKGKSKNRYISHIYGFEALPEGIRLVIYQ